MAKVREKRQDDNPTAEKTRSSDRGGRPTPDWEAYKGRVALSPNEAVALSLSIRLDFSSTYDGTPCEGTEESLVSEFQHRLQIVQGHIEDRSLRARKKNRQYLGGWSAMDACEVDLASFLELAEMKGWKLPPEFPAGRTQAAPLAQPLKQENLPGGATVSLPHTTEHLRELFRIMREHWTKYDPRNPPKQTVIASEIDKALGWKTGGDGKPSRNADTLAALIRPDEVSEADNRTQRRGLAELPDGTSRR